MCAKPAPNFTVVSGSNPDHYKRSLKHKAGHAGGDSCWQKLLESLLLYAVNDEVRCEGTAVTLASDTSHCVWLALSAAESS